MGEPWRPPNEVHDSNWETPPEIFDPLHAAYRFDFDAAATAQNTRLEVFISPSADALETDWTRYGKMAFLNPPYSPWRTMARFLDRADYWTNHGITTVALLPAKVGTGWWRDYVAHKAQDIMILNKRVSFIGMANNTAPFPSAIAVYRPVPKLEYERAFFG